MEEFLGLLLLGLCTAAFCGAICARILDSRWPDLSTLTRLFLVSLAPVLVWVAFQALILPIILSDPAAHAGFVRQWRLYLWEVVLKQALKLWACGIFCAVLMVFFRGQSQDRQDRFPEQRALVRLSGACATAVVLPLAMEFWIENGRLAGSFAFFVIACAFFVGLLPVLAAARALLHTKSADGLRRFGQPIATMYGLAILWRGYTWHNAVANQPGASAVVAAEIAALLGVCVGWWAIHRGNQAAAAALARVGTRPPQD